MTFFDAKKAYLLELQKEMNVYYRNLQFSMKSDFDFTNVEDDILFYYNMGIEDIICYAEKLKYLSTIIGKISLLDVLNGDINYFLKKQKKGKNYVSFTNKTLKRDWQQTTECSCEEMKDLMQTIIDNDKENFQILFSKIINNKKRAEYFTKMIFKTATKHS